MRVCPSCKTEKLLEDFNKSTSRSSGTQPYCRKCQKSKSNESYKLNPAYRAQIRKGNTKRINRNRLFVWTYLLDHPCVDYGESDPVVLEFDHQRDKADSISHMIRFAKSLGSITTEIAKCLVRCANCHRRKTAKDFKYYIGPLAQMDRAFDS